MKGKYQNTDAIHNALSYIFHLDKKRTLPIRYYGLLNTGYPPDHKKLIKAFEQNYYIQNPKYILAQQLWHMAITFPIVFDEPYGDYFYMADNIARIFFYEYPVCYSYHKKTGLQERNIRTSITSSQQQVTFLDTRHSTKTEWLNISQK